MSDKPSTTERIIAELRDRHEKGLAKYGVTVDRADLTHMQWGQHLKEELMDATLYVQRLMDTMNKQESRIKALEAYAGRLEKAGDALNEGIGCGCGGEYGMCKSCEDSDSTWESTKESKP